MKNKKAPDFTLIDQDGRSVRLYDILKTNKVVLYFYPRNNTPNCTTEATTFRDYYEEFENLGAAIVGISGDSTASHHEFCMQHDLPFFLLSDPSGKVASLFGVKKLLLVIPRRQSFVIEQDGSITHSFIAQLQPKRHILEALKALKDRSLSLTH